jgi:hypothetical protein
VGQVHRRNRAQIIEFGSVPGQHGASPQRLEPSQRCEIVPKTAVLVIDHGRPPAQNGVRGQYGVIENETH